MLQCIATRPKPSKTLLWKWTSLFCTVCPHMVAEPLIVLEPTPNFIFPLQIPWEMRGFSFTVRAGSQDWQKQGWDEITGSWRGLKSLAVSGDWDSVGFFHQSLPCFVWSSLPPMGAGISYKIKKRTPQTSQQGCDWSKFEPEKGEEEEESREASLLKITRALPCLTA